MGPIMGYPRVHIAVARADSRLGEQLDRHLATVSSHGQWEISSIRSIPSGEDVPARLRDQLVQADVVALVATARFFNDPLARAEMDLALRRYRAGEIHLLVVHAADCLLDPQLADVPTIAPESFTARSREQFWRTCASRIGALCEASPRGRPRYEDDENLAAGEALRLGWWAGCWSNQSPFSLLGAHLARLRRGGQLRPGDILAYRFHVRRRNAGAPRELWEGYDLVEQRPVEIQIVSQAESAEWLPEPAETVRRYVELRHPGMVKVLTTPREEPGLIARYVVVERFDGAPLRTAVLDGRVTGAHGVDALAPVAEALVALHDLGLAHGDVSVDTIQVGVEHGKHICKVAPTLPFGQREIERGGARNGPRSPAGDVTSFSRVVLACLHGGMLPTDATTAQLRRILDMSEARPELKSVLLRGLAEETARPADLAVLARQLRGGPGPSPPRGAAWLDLEMRPIAGGVISLGARADDLRACRNERPARRAVIHGFSMCAYPVTQRLYTMIIGSNPSAHQDACAPVHCVTFLDALQFCNLLSLKCGLQPAYIIEGPRVAWRTDSDGYRLPTEAEWEHAAKGDLASLYPWGDDEPSDRICWNGAGNPLGLHNRKGPSPVWNHPGGATATGLFDMIGNVWEWCWDWFAPYADWLIEEGALLLEPIGPALSRPPAVPLRVDDGAYRVLRGGAWNVEDPVMLRTTARCTDLEGVRDADIGFRVARGPKPLARELHLRPEVPAKQAGSCQEALAWEQ